MPRTVAKVQGAAIRTQWTSSSTHKYSSSSSEDYLSQYRTRKSDSNSAKMQNLHASSHYSHDEGSLPRYESYDGSGYGTPSPMSSSPPISSTYDKPPSVRHDVRQEVNGLAAHGHYGDFDFDDSFPDPPTQRSSTSELLLPPLPGHQQQRSVNGNAFATRSPYNDDVKFQPPKQDRISLDTKLHDVDNHDVVGRHLLYETALQDTQSYEILSIDEVDELKKEHSRLRSRIEAANRKLALESKVKDATQNLRRLYSNRKDGRPDTPQSPDSQPRDRDSLQMKRTSASNAQTLHQAEEDLAQSIKKVDELNDQIKSLLERRQLVEGMLLKHTAAILAEQAKSAQSARANGHQSPTQDEPLGYAPDDFDGIRDILKGVPATTKIDEEQVKSMRAEHEQHLENLSLQHGQHLEDLNAQHGEQLEHLNMQHEQTLVAMRQRSEQQRQEHETHFANMQTRVEQLNAQLRSVITEAAATRNQQPEPEVDVDQSENVKSNLNNTIMKMESNMKVMERDHNERLQSAAKHDQTETVLAGLWELVNPDSTSPSASGTREAFPLDAFSSRVQHLFDVCNGANEQQDILRRQIEQQRELNGKSDTEKDGQIAELNAKFVALNQSYDSTQQDLANAMVGHETSQREASESRNELQNVMNELERLHKTIEETQNRSKEVEQKHRDLLQNSDEREKEFSTLESEVVRLTTELTMAQAELEGAYGSRKERAKEAETTRDQIEKEIDAVVVLKDQEIETLRRETSEKIRVLESELKDMMDELRDMTREGLESEKERTQLESTIDSLRERLESLEATMADERVRYMGLAQQQSLPGQKTESTSVGVLRQEFKKMMREMRGEGVRLLRTEQEERKKLEAEIRRLRGLNRASQQQLRNVMEKGHGVSGSLGSVKEGMAVANGGGPATLRKEQRDASV